VEEGHFAPINTCDWCKHLSFAYWTVPWLVLTWGDCCDWCRHPCPPPPPPLYKYTVQLSLWAIRRDLTCCSVVMTLGSNKGCLSSSLAYLFWADNRKREAAAGEWEEAPLTERAAAVRLASWVARAKLTGVMGQAAAGRRNICGAEESCLAERLTATWQEP
jgi:hypothetical protein